MNIEITDVKIFKIKRRGALLGYANIVINDCFVIKGIKIIEKEGNRRFVAMPSRPLRNEKGKFINLCHPLNQDLRDLITIAIFDAYNSLENIEE